MACNLVQDLIGSVNEEYKKYCEKNKKTPVPNLAIKREENAHYSKGRNLEGRD